MTDFEGSKLKANCNLMVCLLFLSLPFACSQPSQAGSEKATVQITNNTSDSITFITISPQTASFTNINYLEAPLEPAQSVTFSEVPRVVTKIKLTTGKGGELIRENLDIATYGVVTISIIPN